MAKITKAKGATFKPEETPPELPEPGRSKVRMNRPMLGVLPEDILSAEIVTTDGEVLTTGVADELAEKGEPSKSDENSSGVTPTATPKTVRAKGSASLGGLKAGA